MPTRLGESGADAFTIMRIAGHSSVTVSQYLHSTQEAMERDFERLQKLNAVKPEQAAEAAGGGPKEPPKVKTGCSVKSAQVIEFKIAGA